MKVQFLGAAQTVTGSCYMVEACGVRFAVDCGMHQGNKAIEERNRETAMYRASDIAFILMTHAHIDHSGLLPRIVKEGFKNPVYCTAPTKDLLEIMLLDSAHIQEMEARLRAEKYKRRGKGRAPEPLYVTEDVNKTLPLLSIVAYGQSFEPHPGIKVTFYDAGHIIGSSFLHVEVTEDDKITSAIFSGDLGRAHALIVRDPETPPKADYVFLESTYGDREHNMSINATDELAAAIAYSYEKGEKVIIPAFAVERTQELLYCLHQLAGDGRLPADMPIYVDSPMAIRATEVFQKHADLFDEEAKALLAQGEDPFALPQLQYSMDVEHSRMLNDMPGAAIIISASGMCNAGRIRHHLRHNLWKEGASIVFVGYQGVGTPGRKIVEKAASISLFGDDVPISANIVTIGGFSAHAGQGQLVQWVGDALKESSQIILVHGEENAQHTLAMILQKEYKVNVAIPDYLDEIILDGSGVPVAAKTVTVEQITPIDWIDLQQSLMANMADLIKKMNSMQERPWVEQVELLDHIKSLNYEIKKSTTRL